MSYTYTGTNAVEGRGTRVEGSEADQGRARKLPDGSQPLELAGLWLRHRLEQESYRAGYVYVNPRTGVGAFSECWYAQMLLDSRHVAPGTVAVPVVTLWALGNASDFKAEPLLVATGELPDLGAEVWEVLHNSALPDSFVCPPASGSPILGGDPAACELDPDLEEAPKFAKALEDFRDLRQLDRIEVETRKQVQVQAQVLGLGAECPRHSPTLVDVVAEVPVGDMGGPSRARCLEEGRGLARERLSLGMRPNELMKAVFQPCPYTLGTVERRWWLQGFLEVVNEAAA